MTKKVPFWGVSRGGEHERGDGKGASGQPGAFVLAGEKCLACSLSAATAWVGYRSGDRKD
jgi:hypothetical protein